EPAAPAPRRAPVETPAARAPAAPAPAPAPEPEPVEAETPDEPVRDEPVRDEPVRDEPDEAGPSREREPDSLLGRVTEPLGVSCGGLLGGACG
ncbi:hypothetical protein, partial [Pseudonocardia hydrocarbonoxydans]